MNEAKSTPWKFLCPRWKYGYKSDETKDERRDDRFDERIRNRGFSEAIAKRRTREALL